MPTFKVKVDGSLMGEESYRMLDVNIEQSSRIEDLKTVLTINGVNCDPEVGARIDSSYALEFSAIGHGRKWPDWP